MLLTIWNQVLKPAQSNQVQGYHHVFIIVVDPATSANQVYLYSAEAECANSLSLLTAEAERSVFHSANGFKSLAAGLLEPAF